MATRHPNHRLAKIYRNYTVEEIASLFGVHRNTVGEWIRRGLPTSDRKRPMLILGRDLAAFLQGATAEEQADLPAGGNLLRPLSCPPDTGRRHGGVQGRDADGGQPDRHLPRVRGHDVIKKDLAEQDSEATGEKLSKATLHATLAQLKRFFQWLSGQPGYKSRLRYSDADYFNLSDKDTRVATARREKTCPTMEQVKHVVARMPHGSDIERRNRALVAFVLLTGARDSAIASMKLKHVNLAAGSVYQDAREVKTKFSKTFTTFFCPVGDEVRQIVTDWVTYLREAKAGHAHGPWRGSPVRGGRAETRALEQRSTDPGDLPRCVPRRRPALLQPAQPAEYAGSPR